MSIVSTSNRWLNRLYKTAAILLVLLAVAISAFRLLLPYVHHYQLPLQNYLNNQFGTNISIGSLDMAWKDFGPTLLIGDVQIIETDNASVFIKELELQVDFWKTITQQILISKKLILSGAKVDIAQQLWQQTENDDIPTEQEASIEEEANNVNLISNILLNHIKRFSIVDSQIIVRNDNIKRSIKLNSLRWKNTQGRHQGQGSIVLNGLSSNNLKVRVDLIGEDIKSLTGQVYLQANHIDITPWLDNVLMLADDKTQTNINFHAWLNVNDSLINQLNIDFGNSDMHWVHHDKQQIITLEKGQLLLTKGKKEQSFTLQSTPISMKLNEQFAQNFKVVLTKEPDDLSIHLSDIDVGMVAKLAPLLVAKEKTRQLISTMDVTGKAEDIYIRYNEGNIKALANFSNFTNSYSSGIPGLKNVSGNVSFVNDYLSIDFEASEGELDFDKLFIQPFPYSKLSGQLNANFNSQGWVLNVDKLDFLSEEINLSAQVKVEAPVDGELTLALLTNVYNGNAGLVGRYLPLPKMSESLVKYLNDAIVSGRVEDAQVLINGPIKHFPFTDGSGIFVVDAELSKGVFKFAESWPSINNFDANLNFTNNSMLITGRAGSLTGLDVEGITAGITELKGSSILTVDADIRSTPTQYIGNLMNLSPLESSVGRTLEYININGDVSGEFHLILPLKEKHNAVASGRIDFANNDVALEAPRINFSDVNGSITFSNDKLNTSNLQLTWHDLPISLDVKGGKKEAYYGTDLTMSALWQEEEWLTHIPEPMKKYTHGELPWQGELSLHQHHGGGFSYTANIRSDLNSTRLLLPEPYAHEQSEENSLSINIKGGTEQSNVVLTYGDKLNFSGILKHASANFSRANLTLGESSMALPNDGFHITTKLDYADIYQWQPFINDILTTSKELAKALLDENTVPLLARPQRIRGSIGKLKVLSQTLNNVSFNFLDKPEWWLLQLNSTETRSQIKIYPDWLKQGVDINAEFLSIAAQNDGEDSELTVEQMPNKNALGVKSETLQSSPLPDKAENAIIFNNIPPITFHCDSCSVGLLDLGKVDVKVERKGNDIISINHFKASRGDSQLVFDASWQHNENKSVTSLNGTIAVEDIQSEIEAFSFESIIRDSGAKADFNLTWPGGIHDFDLSRVDGHSKMKVDDGYLADVSDKAKIFSVLSLQSLVRKLTLDFRDIFSDGMFYSDMTGEYQLKNGLLTTHNTEMNGTAGNLFMTGQTNLLNGDLNYDMSYKPNLTSSLPVLAWIATLNPVTFLAGVAIDQVIKSQVVSEFKFKLTGSVENPNFREVDRKNKNISIDTKEENVEIEQILPVNDKLTQPSKTGPQSELVK